MSNQPKSKKDKETSKKIKSSINASKRENMLSDGAYDGRFKTRSVSSKKAYKKPKHKKDIDNQND